MSSMHYCVRECPFICARVHSYVRFVASISVEGVTAKASAAAVLWHLFGIREREVLRPQIMGQCFVDPMVHSFVRSMPLYTDSVKLYRTAKVRRT